MYTYGTIDFIFVGIQSSSTNIKNAPQKKPAMVLTKFELMSFLFGENKYVMCTVPCLYKLEYNISGHDAAADNDDEAQCSTFITLCLVSIGMDHVISEQCYKGTILQRTILWSFSNNSMVKKIRVISKSVLLFALILYVPSTIFQL